MKLNIGAGEQDIPGYISIDRKNGLEAYPTDKAHYQHPIHEIRASHVLEHFPHSQVGAVLKNWVDCLRDGGELKIAVPDFEYIARHYLDGDDFPIQGYTMGGQTDENDFHKCVFDSESLKAELEAAGLVDIRTWKSEIQDCAALPVSLNLMGTKPDRFPQGKPADTQPSPAPIKVAAIMSVPRLGFMDNFFCAMEAMLHNKVSLQKFTGAFWGQCLDRGMDKCVKDGCDWILTIDYDSIFTKEDVANLIRLAQEHPEADAIAPIQAHRTKPTPLMTMNGPDGKKLAEVPFDTFDSELTKIATAHFGLTMIRVESLKKMKKPWFMGLPAGDGTWSEERTDDDIYFWRRWAQQGNTLYLANRVPIGHAELMVRWPGKDFMAIHQHPSDFYKTGKPKEAWT